MGNFTVTPAFDFMRGLAKNALIKSYFETLSGAFHATTGHTHTGATGDGPILGGAALTVVDDVGKRAYGILRIAADVADTETVTIGSHVYEFDTDAEATITAGRIRVDVSGGVTPTAASAALVTAINGHSDEVVVAAAPNVNTVVVMLKSVGTSSIVTTETMGGSGNAWDAATVGGGAAVARKKIMAGSKVPVAAEVTAGNIYIPLEFTPSQYLIRVRVTATGVVKAWDGGITVTAASGSVPAYAVITNAGSTDWAATDTIDYLFIS